MAMDRADGAREIRHRYGPLRVVDRARPRVGRGSAEQKRWLGRLRRRTTTYHYLNNIPFADHGALLDPPTADVTARCISMLAQLGETQATSPP